MKPRLNLLGERFGRLLVIEPTNEITKQGSVIWLCKCDCGVIKKASAGALKTTLKSCGCLEKEANKRKDRIGEKYGMLTIIGLTENRKIVKVRCECGNEKDVRIHNLKRHTKSCGCWKAAGLWVKAGNIKPFGEAAKGSLFASYNREASSRGYSWNIGLSQFDELTKGDCYYCGGEPKQIKRGYNGDYIYNGIDRVNNKIGYEPDNVVSCCRKCNRAKDVMSLNEFEWWIKKVYESLSKKEILKAV